MIAFIELYPTGEYGPVLGRPPTLKSITPSDAERERKKMLAAGWTCWQCDRPPPADAWLMTFKMWGSPHARLVCPSCVEEVKRQRGMRKRWFSPQEGER